MLLATGWTLDSREDWDEEAQRVCYGYLHPSGATADKINRELYIIADRMNSAFKFFEVNNSVPDMRTLLAQYEKLKHPTPTPKISTKGKSVGKVLDIYIQETSTKNEWSVRTVKQFASLKADLSAFKSNLCLDDLTENVLTDFTSWLKEKKVAGRRTLVDDDIDDDNRTLNNSTVLKKIALLRRFLRWAYIREYTKQHAFQSFRPTLKTTARKVIYLTKDELEKLVNCDLKLHPGLVGVRDIFVFCCFSGLRFSDAQNLRWSDVGENRISITTVKTADSLQIDLNKTTREILEKYRNVPIKGDHVLPRITNQAMNRELKDLCRLAGINEKVRMTTYHNNERQDSVYEKWEVIGTHAGRRTFVVQALSLGISPNIVMKWTGHSNYDAMKPYIDIVDSIRAKEMDKMSFL